MSMIETVNDVNNPFLSRREITCTFSRLGGKLRKTEAVDMISKEFKLEGKVIIPIKLKTHTGNPAITGTFYIYEDEKLAKQHVNPIIFKRLDKANAAKEKAEAEAKASESTETKEETKEEKPTESKPTEKAESKPTEKAESKPAEKAS